MSLLIVIELRDPRRGERGKKGAAPELVLMYMILLKILLIMFIIVTIPEAVAWH